MSILLAIFWLAGGIFFFVALIAMLTFRRTWALKTVNGNLFGYLALLICALLLIGGCLYLSIKFYDPNLALEIKNFYNGNIELKYFASGIICLIVTYAYTQIDDAKLPEKYRGKKAWVIIGGSLLGLLSIFMGLRKLHG